MVSESLGKETPYPLNNSMLSHCLVCDRVEYVMSTALNIPKTKDIMLTSYDWLWNWFRGRLNDQLRPKASQ